MFAYDEVKVWDPWLRAFHWWLVAAFTLAYFTEDDLMTVHVWAGYVVGGLLVFRLLWGVIGSRHARFSDFVTKPTAALSYVREVFMGRARRYLGHNPAGGWMIIALLVMLVLTTISGLAVYGADEQAGPLAGLMVGVSERGEDFWEESHEFFANTTVTLVLIHLLGVLVESLLGSRYDHGM